MQCNAQRNIAFSSAIFDVDMKSAFDTNRSIDRSIEWMAAISVESRYEIIKSLIYSRFDAFPLNISTNGTWFYALGQQINQIGIALHR